METQDDSLDLDYLKQAALGMANEQFKLDVSKSLQLQGFHHASPKQSHDPTHLNTTDYSSDPESPTKKMATATGSLPSDTQPISQSALESFLSKARINQAGPKDQESKDDDDLMARDATLHEGDTGHLDLLAAFGETPVANREFVDEDEQLEDLDMVGGVSSPTQYQHFPESQRFINRTPATQNRRSSQSELSTTQILPSFPLSMECQNGSTVMALSQVFNATQNPSSPFTNGPPLSSDMPSPNLPVEPRLTGMPTTIFSPLLPSPITRLKYLEPQTNYVSMKESQAVREKMARLHSTNENGFSDDDFEKDDSYVRRHVREKYTEEEVRKQFANVTAPPRPSSKGHGKRRATNHSSPEPTEPRNGRPRGRALSTAIEVGILERHNSGNSEEETEQEDELEVSQNQRLLPCQLSGDDDKENVDSGPVHVADTTASAHDALSQVLELYSSASHQTYIKDVSGSGSGSQEPVNQAQSTPRKNGSNTRAGSQIVNIANSQPSSDSGQKRRRGRPRKVITHSAHSPDEECIPSSPVCASHRQRSFPPNPQVLNHSSKRGRGRPRSRKANKTLGQSPEEECIPSSPIYGPYEQGSTPKQPALVGRDTSESTCHVHHSAADATLETSHQRLSQQGRSDEEVAEAVESPNDQEDHPETGAKISDNPSTEETAGAAKASSMPSRVLETPTQNQKPSKGFHQIIPQTSPSDHRNSPSTHFSKSVPPFNNNSSASPTHDDDQLPVVPQFSRVPGGHLGVPDLLPSGGPQRTIPAVLSSPSGRQRRSMTEIAAEQSPCQSLPEFLPDFGLISAEDKEFAFITREVGPRSQKRRRGNDGRAISSSNLLDRDQTPTPEEPPAAPQPGIAVSGPMNDVSEPATPGPVQHAQMDAIPIQNRRQAKSAANIWEVECSPVQPAKQVRKGPKPRLNHPLEPAVFRPRTSQHLRHSIAGPIKTQTSKSPSPTPTQLIDRAESPDPIQSEETHAHSKLGCVSPSLNNPVLANKVFAFFNGRPQGYFPATCVGISRSANAIRYLVRFEDSIKPDEVNVDAVKRLELIVNDVVKVDLLQVPKIPHTVVGFPKPNEVPAFSSGEAAPFLTMTDVHGHHSVILRPKGPNGSFRNGPDITVPISNVYFDRILWTRLENRHYSYSPPPLSTSVSGLQTSLDHRPSSALSTSRTPHQFPSVSGLFFGMAFAVSYKDDEEKRVRIEELIIQRGGRILKDGFTELFNQPLSNIPSAPFDKSSVATSSADNNDELLSLRPTAQNTGFVCLLTDEHTRRVKYMQALALNIPCLAGRWIYDCIAKDQIVDWEPYLLPAGESAFLNGAIRSRAIAPNPVPTARLQNTIAARPKLLAGQSVLLVMDRGKIAEQRKPYSFLTCALGPSRIACVQDMNAAIKILVTSERESPVSTADSDVGWDWIYVGDEKAAAAARAQLLKASQSGSPKGTSTGRPRGRPPKKSQSRGRPAKGATVVAAAAAGLVDGVCCPIGGSDVCINGKRVRILDNEFICQSLILGKLFEP
ncbi:hypothetical protein AJ78_00815 [Emergomyces pasteurianus Ep9510]|uniref:BRCT domain-containing protein n=1 Tax=Emergomyces pasteurianus Ep9510 TaxID=1447872 RepID=A0A1J9PTH4_9EURO|nr:hypothetical protein AJ78_00815 [Emergomyces pasteurianus Ep9510]